MFLNGYTILSLFLCLTRLLMAAAVLLVGFSVWRGLSRPRGDVQTEAVENRAYLLFSTATVLIALNVASWPVLYLMLQSYVREWPQIMCVYGVTRIGTGTLGASRFLPVLVTGLQWTKPLVIFASGAGYVLYLVNRRTPSGRIINRVVSALLIAGALTVVDAAIETAYLTIPKSEVRAAGGCCTNTLESVHQASRFTPGIHVGERQRPYLIVVCGLLNLAMIVGLLVRVLRPRESDAVWQRLLCAGALLSIPVNLLFLIDVAAPAILGLPFHHCPYDLITAAPESLLAVALFLVGCFSVGWSIVAVRFGHCDQTREFLHEQVAKLRFIALFGYTGAVLLMSMELLLA